MKISNKIIDDDIKLIIDSQIDWERFSDKTVLISGANGFLPAYIVETLLYLKRKGNKFNVRVIGLVRDRDKAIKRFKDYENDSHLVLIQHDVCNEIFIDEKIDFIIHAASQASPKYYGIDPVGTLNANVLGTINLLRLAVKNNIESFLFFSSGEVYGEVTKKIIREDDYGYLDPTKVRACYGESKRMGENICISYYHQYKVPVKILRPGHTYGPGMQLNDGRVFADFVSSVVKKENIILNSNGSARRNFCYLADATIGFFLVLLNGKNGNAYNIGNPTEDYSILELANIVVNIKPELNLKVQFGEEVSGNNYLKSPIKGGILDITKIMGIGWAPRTSAKEGFKRTIESYLKTDF